MPVLIFILLGSLFFTGCTAIPLDQAPPSNPAAFGPAMPLRVCVLRDIDLDQDAADRLLAVLRERFSPYGLMLEFPWIRDWQRPAFRHAGIMKDVARRPLEAPCDRLLALVGRDARDFVWGALMPEILGAVETRTHAKGYVVAETGSLNQVLSFTSPHQAAVHEMFHLLGLDHADDADLARRRIVRIKQAAVRNRADGRDFFPAVTSEGRVYTTRRAVDRRFRIPPADSCVASADREGCPEPG